MKSGPVPVAIIAGQLVVGGAERQLYLWLSQMDRKRFSPVVATLHPGCGDYWEPVIESMGIPVVRVARRGNRLARLWELVGELRDYKPELVHAWHLFAGTYGGPAAVLLGARGSLSSLRGSFASVQRNRVQAMAAFGMSGGVVVNSHAAGEALKRSYGWICRGIHVVPNAVEDVIESRAEARGRLSERWGISRDSFWVGSMGRFERLKRFDVMLDLAAELRAAKEDVHFLLIGYGPQFKELNAKADALGISDRVTFTGADPEARRWLSALDAFCFLSEDEGLPNVIMEAAVAGVPVLGWRSEFLEELLRDEQSALLVPQGDRNALKQACVRLMQDEGMRLRLGRQARAQVLSSYGTVPYVERMSAVYEGILGQ